MKTCLPQLPAYHVRESRRARYTSLRISANQGLEVVIPAGFDHGLIPALIQSRLSWISRQQSRLALQQAHHAGLYPEQPSAGFHLAALERDFTIRRQDRTPEAKRLNKDAGLVLLKTCADPHQEVNQLQAWLKQVARKELPPRLEHLADRHGFHYRRISIRLQRTRWGSCSSTGTISLNAALLFLSSHLVRHVLLHELCHTRQMNHSPRFWALVAQLEPDYQRQRRDLQQAWLALPSWVTERR